MSLRAWAAIALLFGLAAAPAFAAVDEADLLPVDQAFALSAVAVDRGRIEVSWKIADGYYLYRHRIGAQPVDSAFKFNPLQLPRGEKHRDEFFGEVETYRGAVTAVLTWAAASGVDRLQLRVKYQGCADIGVCYPPQVRTLTVDLPAAEPPSARTAPTISSTAREPAAPLLGGNRKPLFGTASTLANDALPLPPEQAFGFEAIASDGNTLLLRFTPARGYYLYRDRTSLALDADGVALGKPQWPKGVAHRDEHFGDVIVYFAQIDVPLPLRRTRAGAQDITLTATFQGCQNDGICYPPMTRKVRVALPAGMVDAAQQASAGSPSDATTNEATAETVEAAEIARSEIGGSGMVGRQTGESAQEGPTGIRVPNNQRATQRTPRAASAPANNNDGELAEDSRLAAALAGRSRWWTLLGFFGAGLLLAFTPCVLPMIPILSGLIAGQGTRIGTRRAVWLSLVYILANALVFTAAGVVAGLLGANLQVAFQTPWVIVAFSLLFVVLALSSFGVFELQLPMALRARLGAITDHQRGGSMLGVAAMGALSALIVGPCVAPPLAAAVLYIGQSHDPVLGGAALFLLAMGMGVPLLAFGAAAGRGMPTSGPWMTNAQRVFGFVFLALAIWMASRVLPAQFALALYGLLALAMSAWLFSLARPRAGDRETGAHTSHWLARFAGLVLAVIGAAELLGALGGGRDPLQPLAGMFGRSEPRELAFRMIKSNADLDRELAAARDAGKPVLFDFYADWCVSCKEMEKYTFTQPEVHAALADVVLLKADVTANDAVDQALMQRYGIIGPPATLLFVDGRERRQLRLIGFERAAPFAARVRRAKQ